MFAGVGEARGLDRVSIAGAQIKNGFPKSNKKSPQERGREKGESKQERDQDETDA
jgi:hypothetical protein